MSEANSPQFTTHLAATGPAATSELARWEMFRVFARKESTIGKVRSALKLLAGRFPDDFPEWVLIGGGACWFYRESLKPNRTG